MSDEIQLPEHLIPTAPRETIRAEVVDEDSKDNPSIKMGDIAKYGAEMGLFTMNASMMQSMGKVGTELKNAGVISIADGMAYVTGGAMLQVALQLAQDALTAKSPAAREKIAATIAKLGVAIDKQNRTLKMGTETTGGNGNTPPPARGRSTVPNQHVHFHTHEAPVAGQEKILPAGGG